MIEVEFTHRDEDGKEETFRNDSRDLVAWEVQDKQQRSFLSCFASGSPRMVDLYKLAWVAARRLGLIDKAVKFDDYVAAYTVSVDTEESRTGEPDPTSPAASPGG